MKLDMIEDHAMNAS